MLYLLAKLFRRHYKATFYMKSGSRIVMTNIVEWKVTREETALTNYNFRFGSKTNATYNINLKEVEALVVE